MRLLLRTIVLALAFAGPAMAEVVHVAVAANFRTVLDELARAYEAKTGHEVRRSSGSTGTLYAQILRGAPFDVFLAADRARPQALADAGLGEARFTYATGRLAYITRDPALLAGDGPVLADVRTLSIANPRTAPYGAAAAQAIAALGAPKLRIANAQSVAGVNAAVMAGAADAGFAALASVHGPPEPATLVWVVPAGLHDPIRQDAILLARAQGNTAARAFLTWLVEAEARGIIRAHGYDVD